MPDNLIIRRIEESELKSAALLEEMCLGNEAWSYESVKDAFNKEYYYYFIAVLDGVHVGNVLFTRSFDEADISNVCVSSEYRERKIAYSMLEFSIDYMKKEGVEHFTLEVRQGNSKALGLYQKLGFESAGVRPDFYSNPTEDAVIMWKHI